MDKPRLRSLLICLGLTTSILLSGCVDPKVKPYSGNETKDTVGLDNKRHWHEADKLEKGLKNIGVLYQDEPLRRYLQGVVHKLYPEFKSFKVRLYRSPSLNAFSLANGAIYINTGLLARFDNEAQIASVLAHEGAHYVQKHHYRSAETAETGNLVGIGSLLLGLPGLIGFALAQSSIYGYSRDHETEADEVGFKRLVKAGYAPIEAQHAFQHLKNEIETLKIDEPFFFSSHPAIQARIDNFKRLTDATGLPPKQGRIGEQPYIKLTQSLRALTLDQYLENAKYKTVIELFKHPEQVQRLPPYAPYYLGEAYRQRDQEGDQALAKANYEKALSQAPDFAPSLRALGVWQMKAKQPSKALKLFKRYLQLRPKAADRGYIESYIEQLTHLPNPQA